ncbi:hypothetical protein QZH41_013293, partial [Actinostola sp. cb2023]
GETCFYFQKNSVIGTQAGIKSRGLLTAWDIEDLVRVGKKSRACPYYSARELMREADIIFCPYNYLIDPKIRKQMDIDLKDQIIILDEAHNIEDSARESASLTIDTMELQETLDDLDKMTASTRTSDPLQGKIGNVFVVYTSKSSLSRKTCQGKLVRVDAA